MTDGAVFNEINFTMNRLEGSMRTQNDIDSAYGDLCYIIKAEMQTKLTSKHIKINQSNRSNKRRRTGKPWWSETLSEKWNNICKAEKEWLSCQVVTRKARLKSVYVRVRKDFDRSVQRAKRIHWFNIYRSY